MVRVFTLCPEPISCCIALWAALTAAAWAQSPDTLDQTSEQIEALRAEITVIQARLASQENERDALQDALREAEVQIGELDRQLGALALCLAELFALRIERTEFLLKRAAFLTQRTELSV